MPRLTLGKSERIYLRDELGRLFESKKSFVVYPFRVIYLEEPRGEVPTKMMVSIPKKRLKRAVDRNRMKRLVRECFRHSKPMLEGVIPKEQTLLIGFLFLDSRVRSHRTVERSLTEAVDRLVEVYKGDGTTM